MDLEVLRRELEPFGKVEGISRLRVDGVYKVVTERVNVTMVLAPNKIIPSFLTIDGIKFRVFYPGQPPTCMICASPEHLANNCPSNRKRRWENPAAVQERQQQQHQQQKQQDQQQHQQQQQQQQQQQEQQQQQNSQQQQQQQQKEQQKQQQNSQQQQQETPAVGQHRPLAISPKSRKNSPKSSRQLTDFEKTEKRDRRNTLTGRESEETSDSDDSMDDDVDGRDSLPHENTDT
jgi:flagellar biosynthesis GTPase FlhF